MEGNSIHCHCKTRIDTAPNQALVHNRELNFAYCIPSIFINVATSNNRVSSMVSSEGMFHHTGTRRTNQYKYCDVISRDLCHARTYPVATQKGAADLCLYELRSMCKKQVLHTGFKIFLLHSYRYV